MRNDGLVELRGIGAAVAQDFVEIRPDAPVWRQNVAQAQAHGGAGAGIDPQMIVRRRLGPLPRRIHGITIAVDHISVECILHIRAGIAGLE